MDTGYRPSEAARRPLPKGKDTQLGVFSFKSAERIQKRIGDTQELQVDDAVIRYKPVTFSGFVSEMFAADCEGTIPAVLHNCHNPPVHHQCLATMSDRRTSERTFFTC